MLAGPLCQFDLGEGPLWDRAIRVGISAILVGFMLFPAYKWTRVTVLLASLALLLWCLFGLWFAYTSSV